MNYVLVKRFFIAVLSFISYGFAARILKFLSLSRFL